MCKVGLPNGLYAHISEGNIKLGNVPSFSLPPHDTCSPEACAHCGKKCYANKAYRCRPSVKQAWDDNRLSVMQDIMEGTHFVAGAVCLWLLKHPVPYFRIHVSGDTHLFRDARLNSAYINEWAMVARANPDTQFLMYTKVWDALLLTQSIPSNLAIMVSEWVGLDYPVEIAESPYQHAWCIPKNGDDPRAPKNAFTCPGHCPACGYKCWEGKCDVLFHEH